MKIIDLGTVVNCGWKPCSSSYRILREMNCSVSCICGLTIAGITTIKHRIGIHMKNVNSKSKQTIKILVPNASNQTIIILIQIIITFTKKDIYH